VSGSGTCRPPDPRCKAGRPRVRAGVDPRPVHLARIHDPYDPVAFRQGWHQRSAGECSVILRSVPTRRERRRRESPPAMPDDLPALPKTSSATSSRSTPGDCLSEHCGLRQPRRVSLLGSRPPFGQYLHNTETSAVPQSTDVDSSTSPQGPWEGDSPGPWGRISTVGLPTPAE
jgi:hypothetical protein